jgi:hypothetical protein
LPDWDCRPGGPRFGSCQAVKVARERLQVFPVDLQLGAAATTEERVPLSRVHGREYEVVVEARYVIDGHGALRGNADRETQVRPPARDDKPMVAGSQLVEVEVSCGEIARRPTVQ